MYLIYLPHSLVKLLLNQLSQLWCTTLRDTLRPSKVAIEKPPSMMFDDGPKLSWTTPEDSSLPCLIPEGIFKNHPNAIIIPLVLIIKSYQVSYYSIRYHIPYPIPFFYISVILSSKNPLKKNSMKSKNLQICPGLRVSLIQLLGTALCRWSGDGLGDSCCELILEAMLHGQPLGGIPTWNPRNDWVDL